MHGVLLIAAAAMGDLRTVRDLLERGANPNATDRDGWTPLHLAAGWGHAGAIRLLLDHGADIRARNSKGDTPLHVAFMLDQAEAARVLLAVGGDDLLLLTNDLGRTPADWVPPHASSALADVLAEFPVGERTPGHEAMAV
jgi:ankyrin repeat protein